MANLTATLNDVDVSSSIVWNGGVRIEQALGRRWTANITRKTSGTQVGHRVGIYFGATRLFGGTVQEITHEPPRVSLPFTHYRLSCTSWETRLDSKFVNNAVYGQVFYADASTNALTSQYHGLSNNQKIRLRTSDTLPAPLAANTTYYVRDVTSHTFKLETSIGGGAIDITDAGLGTHRFLWLAKDVALSLISSFAAGEGIDTGAGDIDDGDFLEQIVIGYNAGVTVAAALDSIAETCNFIWHLDPDLAFNFKARSTTAAPWNISDDNVQDLGFSYRKTREQYRNKQLIVGSFSGLDASEDTFTGDGTTAQWWLTSRAEAIDSITLDGEPVTLGTDGVETGVQYYWSPGERNLRAETAPDAGASLVVRYRALGANVYEVEDTGEQTARAAVEGGTGIYAHMADDSDNVDANGSVAKAQAMLDDFKAIAEEVRYTTLVDGLMVGQLQGIVVTDQGINANYLIDQITVAAVNRSLMSYGVRAIGGTRLADWKDYFKGLKAGISGSLGTVRSGSGIASASAPVYRAAETWSGNVTDYSGPVAAPADGALFYLRITKSSASVLTWTWDAANFAADVPTNLRDDDGAVTAITFIAESDNLWHVQSWY